jgi:hypothetical protein
MQKNLKIARKKLLATYKGSSVRLTASFSCEIMAVRKQRDNILNC